MKISNCRDSYSPLISDFDLYHTYFILNTKCVSEAMLLPLW